MKLNQSSFAKRIGLESPVSISNYEKNNRKPDLSIAIKIAELGQVTLDWLLTGEGPKHRERVQTSALDENLHPCAKKDLSARADKEGVRTYAQQDTDLAEIVEMLGEDPKAKKAVLKLLRGKKEVAEALASLLEQIELTPEAENS